MNQENMYFEFMGFDPDYEIRTFVSSVAEKLHLNSPSDAALRMAIQKGKGSIKASCQIVSRAGTFVAAAVSDSPIRAVQKLERKIKSQLDHWKAWRFQNANAQRQI